MGDAQIGMIFDIERFSTKDGPGIRTVVFFKGCNMRCFWCHNSEGIRRERQLRFEPGKCIGCMECFKRCPQKAHTICEGAHGLDRSRCVRCFGCVKACCSGALQAVGEEKNAGELLEIIMEDEAFYKSSGGGVTLSGGEVMCQSGFAVRLLSGCREKGVHTAMETNMSFPWKQYRRVLPLTDLVMADIKSMDDRAHLAATGLSNRRILDNIERLGMLNIPFIVRTPVIPGFNDTEENIAATAGFLCRFPSLCHYELLPFHPLGQMKPVLLGMGEKIQDIRAPSRKEMLPLAEAASDKGLKLLVGGCAYKGHNL